MIRKTQQFLIFIITLVSLPQPVVASHCYLAEELFPELSEIIDNIHNNSSLVSIHKERLFEVKGYELASASYGLPHIEGQFNYTYNYEDRRDLSENIKRSFPDAQLRVVQPLFHWGAIQAERCIGKLNTQKAEHQFIHSYGEFIATLRSQYLELYSSKKALLLAEENFKLAQLNLYEAEKKLNSKRITELQFEEIQTAFLDNQLRLELLKQEYTYKEILFKELAGYDCPILQNPSDIFNFLSSIFLLDDFCNYESDSKVSHHYQTLQDQLRIEQFQYKKIRANQLPLVNLAAGVFQDRIDAPHDETTAYRTNYFASVRVNWNIFDGFHTRGLKCASKARQRRLKQEINQELKKFQHEKKHQEMALLMQKKSIKIKYEQLKLANRQLTHHKELLEKGHITHSQFLQHKQSKDQIEINLTNTIIAFLNQFSKYHQDFICDNSYACL